MPAERFGIEIETGFGPGRGYDDVLTAIRAEGIEVLDWRSRHSGHSDDAWTVKYDSSIGDDDDDDHGGCEVVSPPLRFNNEEDRAQVDKVVHALNVAGCRNLDSAGIHIHVSASDLNGFQLANVCRFVWKFEDVMYRIASSGWKTLRSGAIRGDRRDPDGYAKPIHEDMIKQMQKVRDMAGLQRAWSGDQWSTDGDRYHLVNLNSFWIRGTVEFRCFNSSLYSERIQGYIAMCIGIVRDARNGQSRSVAKRFPLGYMHANPHMQKKVLMRFRQVMTCPDSDGPKSKMRQQPPLVSKQDWKRILMCWNDSYPQKNPWGNGPDFAFPA